MKRLIYLALIVLMIAAVYCLNHWCPPVHDELAYTFQGECTPIEADAHHVQNIGDVVKIQIDDYRHGPNGRVFLHSIVTLFSGWELYGLFDVANTGVWFLLCWLVLRAGHSELETSKKWCAGIAFVTFFFWTGEIGCMNSAFCVNYLWSSCLTVLMIQCWRKCESVWMVPLCFLYGWWQEVFSMPMAAALFSCGLIEWMRKKEFLWSNRRCWAWGMMLIGGAGCCGSHLLSGRAARSCLNGVGGMIVELIKAQVKCAMFVWPLVLVCCVLFVLWTHRKRFVALYDAAPEWWMYFLWSMGVWVVLGNEGLRMACPCLLAGVILLVQNRGVFRRFEKMILPAACAVVMWMIMARAREFPAQRWLVRDSA